MGVCVPGCLQQYAAVDKAKSARDFASYSSVVFSLFVSIFCFEVYLPPPPPPPPMVLLRWQRRRRRPVSGLAFSRSDTRIHIHSFFFFFQYGIKCGV